MPLSLDILREMHITLLGEDDLIAGKIRERQNWVGAGALGGPQKAHHVGPPPEYVPDLLEDLIKFINQNDGSNPLLRIAMAHAQFETIHPFGDGNGRTGRALMQYMYIKEGLNSTCPMPISSALMLEKENYFDDLNATRVVCPDEDVQRSTCMTPWLQRLAEATDNACDLHIRLNEHIRALQDKWTGLLQQRGIRKSNAAYRLLAELSQNPIITADSLKAILGISQSASHNAVKVLVDSGILVQRSAGRRNRIFESNDMMDAFTEASRKQPAANLTFHRPPSQDDESLCDTVTADAYNPTQYLCGARTLKGLSCQHPRPNAENKCPAGHLRP